MAYADQKAGSSILVSILAVILLHVGLLFVLIVFLGYDAVKQKVEDTLTFDVQEEEPEEIEEPPPPEEVPDTPPPPEVYTPPSPITPPSTNTARTQEKPNEQPAFTPDSTPKEPTTKTCPGVGNWPINQECPKQEESKKTCWNGTQVAQSAACPPEPPKGETRSAKPKGNPGGWATSADYPPRALREGREGVTRFSVSVTPDGKVGSCSVTGSSGHGDLDDATCKNVSRRGRFEAAMKDGQKVAGSWSGSIRWQIPK